MTGKGFSCHHEIIVVHQRNLAQTLVISSVVPCQCHIFPAIMGFSDAIGRGAILLAVKVFWKWKKYKLIPCSNMLLNWEHSEMSESLLVANFLIFFYPVCLFHGIEGEIGEPGRPGLLILSEYWPFVHFNATAHPHGPKGFKVRASTYYFLTSLALCSHS